MNSDIKYLNDWMWSDAFQKWKYTSEKTVFSFSTIYNFVKNKVSLKILKQSLLIWEEMVFNSSLRKYDLHTVLLKEKKFVRSVSSIFLSGFS